MHNFFNEIVTSLLHTWVLYYNQKEDHFCVIVEAFINFPQGLSFVLWDSHIILWRVYYVVMFFDTKPRGHPPESLYVLQMPIRELLWLVLFSLSEVLLCLTCQPRISNDASPPPLLTRDSLIPSFVSIFLLFKYKLS